MHLKSLIHFILCCCVGCGLWVVCFVCWLVLAGWLRLGRYVFIYGSCSVCVPLCLLFVWFIVCLVVVFVFCLFWSVCGLIRCSCYHSG